MLYFVQKGDSLYRIARRFNASIQDIIDENVICNPNIIIPGQLLIIPEPGLDLPLAGGHPYYVVKPGDTLSCIAAKFGTTVKDMAEGNQMKNPNLLYAGTELLIAFERPNPVELRNQWQSAGEKNCDSMNSLQEHGIFYIGTFMWQDLGIEALPYLSELSKHPCSTVRYYTAMSLGRIAAGQRTIETLTAMLNDQDKNVAEMAALALKRVRLVRDLGRRIHVTRGNNPLLINPVSTSPSIPLPEGTPIITLTWAIPSPTGEEGPRGGIQMFDYVQVVSTGQKGFLPRLGYEEIMMI